MSLDIAISMRAPHQQPDRSAQRASRLLCLSITGPKIIGRDNFVMESQRQALAPVLNAQLDGNPDQLRKGIRLHFPHYLASMYL
jgi:hypothetical protein